MRAVVFKVGAELAALAGGVPLGLGLAPGWAAGRGFAGLAAEWVQREGELAALAVAVVVGSAVAVVADGQVPVGAGLSDESALLVAVGALAAVQVGLADELALGVPGAALLPAVGKAAADAPAGCVVGVGGAAAQRVGLGQQLGCVSVGVALTMSNYGQACGQQCKSCFLGNACNGGWQDGAGHFNKRSKYANQYLINHSTLLQCIKNQNFVLINAAVPCSKAQSG